jgi:hypothetical protein
MKSMCLLLILMLNFGSILGQDSEKSKIEKIGPVELYEFEPSAYYPLGKAHRLNIDPNFTVENVIDTLIYVLNNYDYFQKYNIFFEKVKIEEIVFPNKIFRIGIINIIDTEKTALGIHFQGSTGGATTNMLISSTLIQPQLDDPLLEGLIITYNNEVLFEMDHVDFDRIIPPAESERAAINAIRMSRK